MSLDYEWFSRGNINRAFDTAIEPIPAGSDLELGLQLRTSLSKEYGAFLARAMRLVETKELDEETQERIDKLTVQITNLNEAADKFQTKLNEKWIRYCEAKNVDKGDRTELVHWEAGQSEAFELNALREQATEKVAEKIALQDQEYENADHKEIALAFKNFASPASTMRYPRFEDSEYPEDKDKFGVVYFASKPPFNSQVFINEYMMTPELSLDIITKGEFGKLSSVVSKTSEASESITTDWSSSASVSYGPFKLKASVSSHTAIKTDFDSAESMTISTEALIAVPFNAETWFNPSLFDNKLIRSNAGMFERWLGETGTLRIIPTHLVICRGLKIIFSSQQNWQYDYESDFKAGGSASASVFGIGFGGGGSYAKHVERQNVEKRGHELGSGCIDFRRAA